MDQTAHSKLFHSLKVTFAHKVTPKGNLLVPHGAQFSRFGSVLGLFASVIISIIAVVLIVNDLYWIGIPIVLVSILFIVFLADFQGIEFNEANGNVRHYNSFLGYRTGDWHSLNDFNRLKINEDAYSESRTGGSAYVRRYDTNRYYGLYLMHDEGCYFLKIHENESVTLVRKLAVKISHASELEYVERIDRIGHEVIGRRRIF